MRLFGEKPEDLKHLMRHKYVADEFCKERVAELGHMIADPTNALVFFISKKHEKSLLPLHYKWYNMDYSSEPFTAELLKLMKEPESVM